MEITDEEKKILEDLNKYHYEMSREIVVVNLFIKKHGRKPKTQQELSKWYVDCVFGYDGEYMKIEKTHLESSCFCSNGDCEEEFYMDQIVVCTGMELFHPKCFGDLKIKKPEFEDVELPCSVCHKIFSRVSEEVYDKIWKDAKCSACIQKACEKKAGNNNNKNYRRN